MILDFTTVPLENNIVNQSLGSVTVPCFLVGQNEIITVSSAFIFGDIPSKIVNIIK